MRLAAALVLALALPACATASAVDGGGEATTRSYGREGFYVSAAAVQGLEHFSPGGKSIHVDDSNVGFAARGGWRSDGGLALEAGVEGVTGYNLHSTAGTADLDIANSVIAGKYYVADGRVQPYGLLGVGWAWSHTKYRGLDDRAAFGRVGAGADVYVTRDIALFGEVNYNRMTGGLRNLDHMDMLVGLMFRF